jgi:hypothetical protein
MFGDRLEAALDRAGFEPGTLWMKLQLLYILLTTRCYITRENQVNPNIKFKCGCCFSVLSVSDVK